MKYGELAEITLDGQEPLKGILIKIRNPPKTAILRLPTAQEVLARLESVRQIQISQGNRAVREEWPANPVADAELFEKLRLDSGLEFDEAEIQKALSHVLRCEVIDCEVGDSDYRIMLETAGGVTTIHRLAEPMLADLAACRRKIVSQPRFMARGRQEFRFPPEPVIKLYDRIIEQIENYADGFTKETVPPNHKYAVTMAMITKHDELDQEVNPND